MAKLFQNPDGAGAQAQAVLAYLRTLCRPDGMDETDELICGPEVDRWHNCREQGYVVSFSALKSRRQLNIAFFEHRNSDSICAVEFEAKTVGGNPTTINDIPESHPYHKSKYATSHEVGHGCPSEMAEWIYGRLAGFWNATRSDLKSA